MPQNLKPRVFAGTATMFFAAVNLIKVPPYFLLGQFAITDAHRAAGVLWASLNGVLFLLDHPLRQDILGVSLDALFDSTTELLLRGFRVPAP